MFRIQTRKFFLNKSFSKNIYTSIIQGEGTNEKIFLKTNDQHKSFWHDIPVREKDSSNISNLFNMVIEIPALSRVILEMNKSEPFTPLMHKLNKVVKNSPNPVNIRDHSKDPICNYGFFPQTYSDKDKKFRGLYNGDGDPLDVIEIGGPFDKKAGDVIQVRILGSFCLIDQGEMDWKVVVANSNSISQSDSKEKENIRYIMHWFKIFKTFYGKKENEILDDNKFFSVEETLKVIEESNSDYKYSQFYKTFLESKNC
jgi:inorganic pyrophosphatase